MDARPGLSGPVFPAYQRPASMVRLTKQLEFSASHRYHHPGWSEQRNKEFFGPCNNPHGHGHNYMLAVTVQGTRDPATGMVFNLYDLKQVLLEVLEEFDHKDLNADTPYFAARIPTTENLAVVLWQRITELARTARPVSLRLSEEEDLYVDYEGHETQGAPEVTLTRRYRFSAAHRLHSEHLSEDQNRTIFGKCNNPKGHGHNYIIEVSVGGAVDADTGMVTDLARLDHAVDERIVKRFDHQHINYDPAFTHTTTTGENLAVFIWNELEKAVPIGRLEKVGVVETRDNYFEYRGPDRR